MTYTSLNEKLTGRNTQSRKIGNNTYAVRKERAIAVKLHNTEIVTFHQDGAITFDSGGWRTSTTKARMNEFSPARVLQARGVWTISIDGQSANYADGITWTDKKWIGAGEDPKEGLKLVKRLSRFAGAYMDAFDSGNVPTPSNGDCWGCLMVATNGERPMGGKSHILDHLDENYFVPSLLMRAIERFPVSQTAKAYISDKWAGTDNGAWFASIGKEQLRKSLYRFLKAEIGIAA